MPPAVWLLVASGACLVVAVVGGAVKLFGAEFPPLKSMSVRLLLAVIGAAGLFLSWRMGIPGVSAPATTAPITTAAANPAPAAAVSSSRPNKVCDGQTITGNDNIQVACSDVGQINKN